MRKYLIASHGVLASGIKSSLDLIIGETENVWLIQAYVNENKSIEDDIAKILENILPDDELIVFTDLLGGSVTNQILRTALKENVYIISGFNLPLLIDILLADADIPVSEVVENGINNARNQIVFVNQLINSQEQKNHD